MPAQFLDSAVETVTGGEVKKFGEFLSKATEKHTIADKPIVINPRD